MKKNKIATVFFISILALAGIGITYAGFTDEISIYGYVTTGNIDFSIVELSSTYVWKIYNINQEIQEIEFLTVNESDEVAIYQGPDIDPLIFEEDVFEGKCDYERISWAIAIEDGGDDELELEYYNIFPCIDFIADFVIYYSGTIPGKISWPNLVYENGDDFTEYLEIRSYSYSKIDDDLVKGLEITQDSYPFQIHSDEYIGWELNLHLPQDNNLLNKQGEFSFDLSVIQWNDLCINDQDGDGISDEIDNCPNIPNPDQMDDDLDGFGSACDCDDNDPDVNPLAEEICDGKDNDCNGEIDEDCGFSEGDIIITEIMANPDSVSDRDGEFFEIYNTKNSQIELFGWKFSDLDGDFFEITTSLLIPANQHLVFCCNNTFDSNGGVSCDYVFDYNDFSLGNSGDEIIISTADDIIIDQVIYDGSEVGISNQLCINNYNYLDNDNSIYWCSSSSLMPGGDLGTPGAINLEC